MIAGLALALAVFVGQAATPPTPAPLSDVQKLTILTTVQRLEIAQLRAQAAQRELEGLLKSLQLPGYTLDLNTLTYVPQRPSAPTK